jgi:ABC-type multidrug transport system permease subunit
VATATLAALPVALLVDIIYGSIVYWPTNFARDVTRYLIFLLILFAIDSVMAAYLRTMAVAWPSQEVAAAVGIFAISLLLLCAGFYVIRSQMPVWLNWLPWLSP